ncbi:hypothetical protein [Leuconostoc falkenbergense]|uniref:hypothetical protein n=1 Tax=Leuconostoc falkenbergense TaxID=2766470 RepID=UPI0038969B55
MFKGVINYQNGKIPFVIDDYRMSLFSEEELVSLFARENNFKKNYILTGQCFISGNISRPITLLVESSMGSTCYLTCFILNRVDSDKKINSINFESKILDSIFQYKYHYLDLSRVGINLGVEKKEIYSIPFNIKNKNYELKYLIGKNSRMGLLEHFKMCGVTSINLQNEQIKEYYKIIILMTRFCKFITSNSDVSFERVTLSEDNFPVADIYCKYVSDKASDEFDIMFREFEIMKYVPKILNNLALELDSKITKSIPLGHIEDYGNLYTPYRFIEQITAFEYLFEKLEPKKAKSKEFPLKTELKLMFDMFTDILNDAHMNSDEIATKIKKIRVNIIHGYAYYYDFDSDINIHFIIIKLSDLIQRMSLKHIGFREAEISEFRKEIVLF